MGALKFPQVFDQANPKWSGNLLGFNTDPKFSIGNCGCLLTCLGMVCNFFKFNETPSSLNERLKNTQGFSDGGDYIWGSISKVYPKISEKKFESLDKTGIERVKRAIKGRNPVILEIDSNPEDFKFESHFVLVSSINPKNINNIKIADPIGERIHSIKDYLREGEDIFGLVKQYIVYSEL